MSTENMPPDYYKLTWIVSGQQAYNTVYCCVVQLRIGALCQTRYCITNTSATFVRMLLRLAFQMQALTRYPRRFLTRIVTVSVRNGTCIAREASHLQGDAGGWVCRCFIRRHCFSMIYVYRRALLLSASLTAYASQGKPLIKRPCCVWCACRCCLFANRTIIRFSHSVNLAYTRLEVAIVWMVCLRRYRGLGAALYDRWRRTDPVHVSSPRSHLLVFLSKY